MARNILCVLSFLPLLTALAGVSSPNRLMAATPSGELLPATTKGYLSVPDPEKTADFYCEAFDMQRVGTTDSPLATGVYVRSEGNRVLFGRDNLDQDFGFTEGVDEETKTS